MDQLRFLPEVEQASVVRWDREWMLYFSTEDMSAHLVESKRLKVVDRLEGKTPEQVFKSSLCALPDGSQLPSLKVWARGEDLIGKDIVEIGCGCAFFGKQIGLVANSYLGLDLSQLALAISRGNSPSNCTYVHLPNRADIAAFAGSRDTMVGREFFIHQNFENAIWVLMLGSYLLKPGGIIAADFYSRDPDIEQGIVHPAKSPLDPNFASCAFEYEESDVAELAELAGLDVLNSEYYKPHQRRFVTFRKPA